MDSHFNRWIGKTAIVTGASSGIGEAISVKLVKLGINVIGFARRADRLEHISLKLKIEKGTFHACKVDITKEDEIKRGFQWATENVGPIHILINNAAEHGTNTLVDGDADHWKQLMETNVIGLCVATREAIKNMTENHIDGHIININSVTGHKVHFYEIASLYPASKFALTALTETFRYELINKQSKIKMTSLSPGNVLTEAYEKCGFDLEKLAEEKPFLKPSDIADNTVYILSTAPEVLITELTVKPLGT